LLRFRLDLSGFTDGELAEIGLSRADRTFPHIPTGLMAAGFLANVAMLEVDQTVREVIQSSQVAVFRYVDDHIILAPSFKQLEEWVTLYKKVLEWSEVGASFNEEKFEPREFGEYFSAVSEQRQTESLRAKAVEKCRLDPRFPVPLMTQTLAKLSDVTGSDIELLDDLGQEALLADLEHLMLTDFPHTELPPATRVSFAAGRIARIAAERLRPVSGLTDAEQRVFELKQAIKAKAADREVVIRLSEDLAIAKREFFAALRRYQLTDRRDCRRTFGLLIKALHDYPEKFRLWQHVLNYCRLSGHRDLGPVFDELDEYMEKNPLAGRFVRASILKVLTWHVIASARFVAAPDALPRRRRKALRYLLAVLKLTRVEDRRDDASFYEKASEWAFRGAVGSVAVFLADPSAEAGIRSDMVLLVDKRKEELAAIDWAGSPEDWVVGTEHSLAVWSWWAESRLQPADAISAWRDLATHRGQVTGH
jgi:hypothetical protein